MFKEISITEQKQKQKKNDLITKIGGTAEVSEDEQVIITHAVILRIIKLKLMKVNKQALSAGKSSFLRVVVLIQVRNGWYGITIL